MSRKTRHFLPQVAKSVEACNDLLILGPGLEKTALLHYLQAARPGMGLRLEASGQPSDAEIIAAGRKHFRLDWPTPMSPDEAG
ncbi:MAG TPA: hypothetical protein VNY08_20165 [Bradyrhizobium sp.]|jgi:hypothetical protein|nr:hypothetical protein [Bradyrhizobium sp.]